MNNKTQSGEKNSESMMFKNNVMLANVSYISSHNDEPVLKGLKWSFYHFRLIPSWQLLAIIQQYNYPSFAEHKNVFVP